MTVVDMIPATLSNELFQDSEPNLAVNPADTRQIAASAFTPDPQDLKHAPIFVSTDSGATWSLNAEIPGGGFYGTTADVTLRFATDSNILYAGIIRGDNLHLNLLRAPNFLAGNTLMEVLEDRQAADQPYIQAASASGTDRVFMGNNNNLPTGPQTATVDVSQNVGNPRVSPALKPVLIETRTDASTCEFVTPCGSQDAPSIRPAIHPDGTIYAAFLGWRTLKSDELNTTTDVVVVRDDNWGKNGFVNLVDPDDNKAGLRVAMGINIPSLGTFLGSERVGSSITIAVDPTNSSIVYLAWADGLGLGFPVGGQVEYTIHLRRSIDRGVTWSGDLRSVTQATNPALAINSEGEVAFLYQKINFVAPHYRWQTHLETSKDGFASPYTDWLLADVVDITPQFMPSIGDYIHVQAMGTEFFGVFSGDNVPDLANFPHGVNYQRYADFNSHILYGDIAHKTPVPDSVDPYFFRTSLLILSPINEGIVPVLIDPTSGTSIPFGSFNNPSICVGCQYALVTGGSITNVTLQGLQVIGLTTSSGTLRQFDTRGNEWRSQVQSSQSRKIGRFSDNPIFRSLLKKKMTIVGLVISDNTLKGIIASRSPFRLRARDTDHQVRGAGDLPE